MAEPEQVTEPATPYLGPTAVTEPAVPATAPARRYDPRKLIRVYNTDTGTKNPRPVPETWLGQFPNLKEVPSSQKAGK